MKNSNLPLIVVGILGLILFFSRILPHQPNFTPVLALCLFSGFFAKGRWYSLLLPLLALIASDWVIGFYPGWGFNYVALVLILFSGAFLSNRLTSFVGFGLVASLNFFLLSNLGVWFFAKMYPMTFEGLLSCYEMGLPFFRSTLVGTTFFMVVFYGVSSLLKFSHNQGISERA